MTTRMQIVSSKTEHSDYTDRFEAVMEDANLGKVSNRVSALLATSIIKVAV